jgi:hypothetical protein
MARADENIILSKLRGTLGDTLVFRQRNGKTFVYAKPRARQTQSPAQQERIDLFREAVQYAKSAMNDPVKKKVYKSRAEKGTPAYNTAISDFMKMPRITKIDTVGYNGKKGSRIIILTKEKLKLAEVTVRIRDARGKEVESGPADPSLDGMKWTYHAIEGNHKLVGSTINVKGTDLPGRSAESSVVMES